MKSRSLLCGAALALSLQAASAGTTMNLQWVDRAGDAATVGDVISVRLSFDASGAWTATWMADAAHPFTGNARFNLNLFDTALGNLASAHAPQLSLDGFHDFGASKVSEFSYSGKSAFLANWHVGDVVSTGNTTNFISGLVNMVSPYGRDNMVTGAVITASVPEPGALATLSLGLGLLAFMKRRHR